MATTTVLEAENEEAAVNIGSRRELFVDSYLIDKLDGLKLVLQKPQPGGVAVRYDGQMDGVFNFFTTVLKDGDTYRMYYRGHPWGPDWTKSVTCYAESKDGIHWTKPDLGIVEVNGSKKNNAILPIGRAFAAFLDSRPGVPASERYKGNLEGNDGLKGYVSSDGIHWNLVQEEAIITRSLPNHFDSQNVMFWSEVEQCYCLYARYMEEGKRTTARATSKDFRTWSAPAKMTYGDTGTAVPSQQLYTNQTQPYFRAPQIYISLPGRFQVGRRVLSEAQARATGVHGGGGGAGDIADGAFMTTRAGSDRYDFTFRESFVRPGIGDSNWTSRNNYPALGVVQTGPNEMSFYVQRNYGQKTGYLERMALRLDGFVSVNAPYSGGQMVTRPLTFSGNELEINYSTSAAGSLRIEVQNAGGRPVPDFALNDCSEIIGDHIARIVAWKGSTDLSKLAGETIRLRFVMKDADLYAIRFR